PDGLFTAGTHYDRWLLRPGRITITEQREHDLGSTLKFGRPYVEGHVEPVAPLVVQLRQVMDDSPRFKSRHARFGHRVHVLGIVVARRAKRVGANILDYQDFHVRSLS